MSNQDLVSWEESDGNDSDSIKGVCAELAACIGPELAQRTAITFEV